MTGRRLASILGCLVVAGATVDAPTATAAARADISLNPLSSQVAHRAFPVTGRLTRAGTARGKVVRIELQERGRWVVIAHQSPAANGQYRIPSSPTPPVIFGSELRRSSGPELSTPHRSVC